MTDAAWLDSLSEDWVSQPRSDTSQAQLPSLSLARPNPRRTSLREHGSKVVRPGQLGRKPQLAAQEVLSERSSNHIILGSKRQPSRAAQEAKASQRGRHFSRSMSASSVGSVVHNDVQQKSYSASPGKDREEMPEWRRRLLYGDIAYGEAKDLFSSVADGLENIFRPPQAQSTDAHATYAVTDENGYAATDTTLPSSPPPYNKSDGGAQGDEEFDQSNDALLRRRPTMGRRNVKYKRNVDSFEDLSRDDASLSTCEDRHLQDTSSSGAEATNMSSASTELQKDVTRKVSGKSDVLHEGFSPILIGKRDYGDGQVSFAPIELPAEQLAQRLDKLRRNQMLLDSDPGNRTDSGPSASGIRNQIVETTEDFERQGGFLNTRRGGRSTDDSFRNRPLSPPLNTDSSEMLPESSLQASTPKQFMTVRTERASPDRRPLASPPSPMMPRAPYPSPEKNLQVPRPNGGSPLKLFGPYDTYTNQTLLRRISQFEDQTGNSPARSIEQTANEPDQSSPSKSEFNRGFMAPSSPIKPSAASQSKDKGLDAVNKFGVGELDGYTFTEEASLGVSEHSEMNDKENVIPGNGSMLPTPISLSLGRHSSPSEGGSIAVKRRRDRSNKGSGFSKLSSSGDSSPQASQPRDSSAAVLEGRDLTQRTDVTEGKRPRTSPSKDRTPKRRRTLHETDIAFGLEGRATWLNTVQTSHHQLQSVIDAEWEARQGDMHSPMNPTVLALRQPARPRTPTPSQRSTSQRGRQPLADLDPGIELDTAQPGHKSAVLPHGFTQDGSRKTSIKTQDFFDEAERIMAMIRSKARPNNGLHSVEESEAGSAMPSDSAVTNEQDDSWQDSTREPLSRPPSREGRPQWTSNRRDDPELVERLKQYEETSDMGDLIAHSMRSMGLARNAIQDMNEAQQSVEQTIRNSEARHPSAVGAVISDLPNVRISRNLDVPNDGEYLSLGTHSSGHSVQTTSSRGSDSRRLIAPNVVSELIGNQVGNMVLDEKNNMWVKVKTPRATLTEGLNTLPSEESEEDPFASIPDLSVDMTKENQHLELKAAPLADLEKYVQDDLSPTPTPMETKRVVDGRDECMQSKDTSTKFSSSGDTAVLNGEEEVEHEITIHDDRSQKSSPSRRRNLTISFSSPIASIIQDTLPQHSDDEEPNIEANVVSGSVGETGSWKRGRRIFSGPSPNVKASASRSRSRSQRTWSVRGQAFIPRPVSRIDEGDEGSVVERNVSEQRQVSVLGESSIVVPEDDGEHQANISILITPAPPRQVGPATPTIRDHVGNLSLSPLSEFTMTKGDQSLALEVSYVVENDYLVTGAASNKILSQAIRDLVEKITEVEPFEPDWDAMQVLDISNKRLKSLHKLDEFCASIVTLDASHNEISHLDGVPEDVRNLKMTHNQLSELTAWGHLINLQYVDVSNNQLTSLYAFKDLVHLRSLRADNNLITSLDGIKFHDSIQTLRVRGNLIQEIDMDGTKLQRLTELDLEGNQIRCIRNIEQLSSLATLNLKNNCLSAFAPTTVRTMPSLKYLELDQNMLTSVDLAAFPGIRLFHADRNHLVTISGLSRARRLDSLSLREQRGDIPLDLSFIPKACEVRKLYLSGNMLTTFDPHVDFLNLQLLELANCGLQSLGTNVGQLMPNLRSLNLSFNAIKDLFPLRYIPRLKKLLVAGNRLLDTPALLHLLGEFPHLNKLDMRGNPATLGFYPPITTLVPREPQTDIDVDLFVLPDANKQRDETFAKRLDMDTKKKRRYHQVCLSKCCARLKVLDGLVLDREVIMNRDDEIWKALVGSGAIVESSATAKPNDDGVMERKNGGVTGTATEY